MSRYQYTKIINYQNDKLSIPYRWNGITRNPQIRETTIYPNIERSTEDLYVISKITDRLDLLANEYYGDSSLWWVIALANNIGKGTLVVDPGLQLRIPHNPTEFRNKIRDSQL